MDFVKKHKLLFIMIGLIVIAGITALIIYVRNFPLQVGSKNKYVEIWRNILTIKNFEVKGTDLIFTDGHPKNEFTSKMEEKTKQLYGVAQVSLKLFNQERKKYKNEL